MRADSKLAALLIEARAPVDRREVAPFINFGGARDFEEFEKTLPPKARSNRHRRMHRIQQLGDIAFETCVCPARAAKMIAIAMVFKREWALKNGHYAPAVFDPRFERCFEDAARRSEPNASLRVFAMLCDGRPIGVEISYGYKGRLFAHVLAPNPAYAKYGLGIALADAAVRAAFTQGYETYDLLAPADSYKAAWTKSGVEVMDFTLILSSTRRLVSFAGLRSWTTLGAGRQETLTAGVGAVSRALDGTAARERTTGLPMPPCDPRLTRAPRAAPAFVRCPDLKFDPRPSGGGEGFQIVATLTARRSANGLRADLRPTASEALDTQGALKKAA